MSPLVKKARYQVNLRVVRGKENLTQRKKELTTKTLPPTPIGMKDN